jgi:hypothetical protein
MDLLVGDMMGQSYYIHQGIVSCFVICLPVHICVYIYPLGYVYNISIDIYSSHGLADLFGGINIGTFVLIITE